MPIVWGRPALAPAGAAPPRSSLRARWGAVGAVVLLASLVGTGVAANRVGAWQRAVERRSEVRIARIEAAELRRALGDQMASVRSVAAGGEFDLAALDATYRDGVALERTLVRRLHAHSGVAGAVTAQVDMLTEAADRWRADTAAPVWSGTSADGASVIERDFAPVALAIDRLETTVQAEVDRAHARARTLQRQANGVLVACAVAVLAIIVLVAALFRRWVTRPLSEIGSTARRMLDDDTTTWPDAETTELQDVTEAIRSLQCSLVQERDRAVTAYRGLEQSAILALRVRAELSNQLGTTPAGWELDSALVPAEGVVAGDCYDTGLLDQQHLYAIVIDVTGHGAAAALDALKAKSQLRGALRAGLSPGDAIAWLARENERDDELEMLTAAVIVVDLATGACEYAVAGHPPPILIADDDVVRFERTGPLVGGFPSTWGTGRTTVPEGATVVMYTDGITEAMGLDRARFGEERLVERLRSARDRRSTALVETVLVALEAFRVGPSADDVTVLALHRTGDGREGARGRAQVRRVAESAADTSRPRVDRVRT